MVAGVVVLLLALFMDSVAAGENATATVGLPICMDFSNRLVGNSPQGIQVQVLGGAALSFNLVIPGHSLSRQCEPDPRRCHVIIRDRYLAISAVGSVVVIDLEGTSSQIPYEFGTSEQVTDVPDCSPTDLFYIIDDGIECLVAACETASSSLSTWRYLSLFLSDDRSSIDLASSFVPLSNTLESDTGFSQTVLVRGLCIPNLKLFFISDDVISSHGLTGGTFFTEHIRLQNCTSVSYLEHIETSEEFTIYCSNGVAIVYSICSESAEYYYLDGAGIPFSCPPRILTVMYKTDSIDVVRNSDGLVMNSLNHSVGEIRFGRCLANFFTAIATDGSLFVINVNTGSISAVADVCSDDGTCVQPAFSSAGFSAYDFRNSTLLSVNFVEECDCPIVEMRFTNSLQMSSLILMPSLISATATGQQACECGVCTSAATSPPATTSPPDATPPEELPDTTTPPDGTTAPLKVTTLDESTITTGSPGVGEELPDTGSPGVGEELPDTITTGSPGVGETEVQIGSTAIASIVAVTVVLFLLISIIAIICAVIGWKKIKALPSEQMALHVMIEDANGKSTSTTIVSGLPMSPLHENADHGLPSSPPEASNLAMSGPSQATAAMSSPATSVTCLPMAPQLHATDASVLPQATTSPKGQPTPPPNLPVMGHPATCGLTTQDLATSSWEDSDMPSPPPPHATSDLFTPSQATSQTTSSQLALPRPTLFVGTPNGPTEEMNSTQEKRTTDEPGSPLYDSPHDAQGSGHGSGFVTGMASTVVPTTLITSDSVNEKIRDETSTDDKRNNRSEKIDRLP